MKKAVRFSSGYTLVELLIAIAIMGLLFAFGVANYRAFARRQVLFNTVKKIQADLRVAQQSALSGLLPNESACNGTNTLNGYNFNVTSQSHYEIRASCSGGSATEAIRDVDLGSDIIFASPFPVPNPLLFKVLGIGTNMTAASTTLNLLQNSSGMTSQITITKNGRIQ